MDNSIIDEINKSADKVQTRYGTLFPSAVKNHVVDALVTVLAKKTKLVIYSDEKKNIEHKIMPDNNSYSTNTRLHIRFYNHLIGDLDSKGIVTGDPMDLPLKITRQLVLTPENNLDNHIRYVQTLHDDLLTLRNLPKDIEKAEIDCVCTFIASATIFAKITFPRFHRWILTIRYHDIHLNPDYINCQVPNTNAFYRFILPYPANLYFLRCARFYMKKYKQLERIKPQWNDDPVFQPKAFNIESIASIFSNWMAERLSAHKEAPTQGFTISSFYKAAQATSMIDLSSNHINANQLPPFIISAQAGDISCYSYSNIYFDEFLGLPNAVPEYSYQRRPPTVNLDPKYMTKLKAVFDKILCIRRPLLKQIDSMPLRREAINEIIAVANDPENGLSTDDAQNLSLYAEWLKLRLLTKNDNARHKYLDFKSFNDHVTMVETFLQHISGAGPIITLSPDFQEWVIQNLVYSKYGGHNVKDIISMFTTFLETGPLKDVYVGPNWQKKEMEKRDVPELKAFITPKQLQVAIKLIESKLFSFSKVKEDQKIAAVYNARVIGIMTELAYYSGMRIHEIALLQLKDVILSDGIVLCIRKGKTKTDHGERNIPLSYLAPQSFLDIFIDYWKKRKEFASVHNLLFPQIGKLKKKHEHSDGRVLYSYRGKAWDTSYLASLVSEVFADLGVDDMSFHNTRDSFTAILLLRWIVAFHRDLLPADLPFLSYELFNDNNIAKFRKLVLGMGTPQKHQDSFSHIMAIVAKLLGHGGPIVSLECYVHVVDWLFYFFTRQNTPEHIDILCEMAEDFLQVSYPSLPDELKGRSWKSIKTETLLQQQRERINFPRPNRPTSRPKSTNNNK